MARPRWYRGMQIEGRKLRFFPMPRWRASGVDPFGGDAQLTGIEPLTRIIGGQRHHPHITDEIYAPEHNACRVKFVYRLPAWRRIGPRRLLNRRVE